MSVRAGSPRTGAAPFSDARTRRSYLDRFAFLGRRAPKRAADAPLVVAMVTDAIYPYHMGGKETRTRHISAGLAAQGVEVHVYTMKWWTGAPYRVEDGVHYHALCRHYPLYNSERRSTKEAIMFALACLRLIAYRYDLIDADHMPHLQLFPIRVVAWLRRVPLVSPWHEYWGREYWQSYMGPLGLVAAAIEQVTMRLPDRLVTDSPGTRASLVAQGIPAERIAVVPVGLDLATIEAARPSSDAFDVLYVGRLLEHKHVDWLLESLETLRRSGTTLRCGIVGEGPERARLEQQCSRLGIDDQVRFLGNFEDDAAIFGLMKSAGVFVLPSVREGFGIVVAEAIVCGVPVITIDHPENHSRVLVDVGVTGWLCAPNAASLAETIGRSTSTSLDRSLQPSASSFGWQTSVTTMLEVFTSLVPPHRSRAHA